MSVSTHRIREDFDRIALLSEHHREIGDIYYKQILRHLPPHCLNTLEVGCGTGEFTRHLARRSQNVVAIDLSPQMIRLAKQRPADHQNIEYVLGDVMQLSLAVEGYDCIALVATLHHLPLEQALLKLKVSLKPNGTLIIHDLIANDGFVDWIIGVLAVPVSCAWRFWRTGRLRSPLEVREAWAEHGKDEIYLTLSDVNEMRKAYLPNAEIHRHLLWRYTLIWRKGST